MRNKIYTFLLLLSGIVLGSCEDTITVNPQDALTLDSYFKTEEQCSRATALLYGFAWFNMNDKAGYAIGDLYAGNMYATYVEFLPFQNYSVAANNLRIFEAWSTCYVVIAHSNSIINNLPRVAAANGISEAAINGFVAEAKFMRANAYFYLTRLFNDVPIIEDGAKVLDNPIIPRIKAEDVYKLIVADLQFAKASLPLKRAGNDLGRVTTGAASAALAKVYLTQKNYAAAKTELETVINAKVFKLLPKYGDLFFRSTSNNNEESIWAWQWVANKGWGTQNTTQAYFAISSEITKSGDGWGTVLPSLDLLADFEAGDLRKHDILMQDGDFYPELLSDKGGFTFTNDKYDTNTQSGIKKYVVGSPADDVVGSQSTGINTNVIRYADVLLMYTEAVMGDAASTADTKAVGYFNDVRARAGLSAKTSVTRNELLHERRIEFAFEGQYFYDVVRIKGETAAMQQFSNVERGRIADGAVSSVKYNCTRVKFEVPTSEADQNPLLKEPAQSYTF